MKVYSLIALLLLIPFLSKAIDSYKTGDELNVLAVSGLNLRDTPGTKGTKLTKIPYGEKVTVLPTDYVPESFSVSEKGGVLIEGRWVMVNYKDTLGYVFDGYLSTLPAPSLSFDPSENNPYLESYLMYLDEEVGEEGQPFDVEFYGYETPPTPCSWSQNYRYGMVYSEHNCGENGIHATWSFTDASFDEVYLIALILFFDQGEDVVDKQYTGAIEIGPEDGGAGCYHTVREKESGGYEIVMYCGC